MVEGRPNKLDVILGRDRAVVMDGGMGSTVEDRGIDVRNDLWGSIALLSETGRSLNDGVHRDMVDAGAEILIANSHNASLGSCRSFLQNAKRDVFEPELLAAIDAASNERRAHVLLEWLNRQAIESVRRGIEASNRPSTEAVVIAAGIGSSEGAYATASRLTPEEVEERLSFQTEVLVRLGIDLLIFETLSTKSEIEGVARVLRRASSLGDDVRCAVGLTTGQDGRTLAGVEMAEVASLLSNAAPDLYFIQCTRYDIVEPALVELMKALGRNIKVGAYGNDGRVWRDRRWHGERISPSEYSQNAKRWRELGAEVIGGCCGTGPDHIRSLSLLFDRGEQI